MRYGAGAKGKVATNLCHGLPQVTSPIAVEGMPLEAGEHVVVADTAESFAEHVVDLCRNESLWAKISDRGLELARACYSPEAGLRRVARLLEEARGG